MFAEPRAYVNARGRVGELFAGPRTVAETHFLVERTPDTSEPDQLFAEPINERLASSNRPDIYV